MAATYDTDQPLSDRSDDAFNRATFADHLFEIIRNHRNIDPLVLAINGQWGSGKTTVINFLYQSLQSPTSGCIPVKFNPWLVPQETILLQSFFTTIANELGTRLDRLGETLRKHLESYGDIVTAMVAPALDKFVFPGSGPVVKWLMAFLKISSKKTSQDNLKLKRDRIESTLRDAKSKVVIILDDIDRLDAHEILSLFRLIKLTADFQNTIYVLSYDEDVVIKSINQTFGSGRALDGRDYLEKIVQVSLHLPHPSPLDFREYALNHINRFLEEQSLDLSRDEISRFVYLFDTAILPHLITPRLVKKYLNGIRFILPGLYGEVSVTDLLLLEAVRLLFPAAYDAMRQRPGVFLGVDVVAGIPVWGDRHDATEAAKSELESILKEIPEPPRRSAMELIHGLFPWTTGQAGDGYLEEWTRLKRVCSLEYWERYFGYGIGGHDVSDNSLLEILRDAGLKDPVWVATRIREMANERNAQKIALKLRYLDATIEPRGAENIALGISRAGSIFPSIRAGFDISVAEHAAVAVRRFIGMVPADAGRDLVAKNALLDAETDRFACYIYRHLFSSDKEEKNIIRSTAEVEFGRLVADRIAGGGTDVGSFLDAHEGQLTTALYYWNEYGDRLRLREFLASGLRERPSLAVRYLIEFVGRVLATAESSGRAGDLDDVRKYKSIVEYVDGAVIADCLVLAYGAAIAGGVEDESDRGQEYEMADDQRIARQFLRIHTRMKKSEAEGIDQKIDVEK